MTTEIRVSEGMSAECEWTDVLEVHEGENDNANVETASAAASAAAGAAAETAKNIATAST